MTTRQIPPVDTKQYASPGRVHAAPNAREQAVVLEMHYCSAYLSRVECLMVVLQLIHGGQAIWGERFTQDVQLYLEQGEGGVAWKRT